MDHLHLLIPALFPTSDSAAEACAGLRLPALERMLAGSRIMPLSALTLEDRLCAGFGVSALAPLRAAADGLDVSQGYWLCADPVHLQLQRTQMLLLPDVSPSQAEAAAFCAALNEHFNDSGLQFFAPHPARWYVRLDAAPRLSTTPLRQAAWRDAKLHQPQGADALLWQRMLTEIQMLLYAHPLNQAREAHGVQTVSSVWLWGGGYAQAGSGIFDVAGGDSGLVAACAPVLGLPRSNTLQEMLDGQFKNGLWVAMAAGNAWQLGDVYAWREALDQMEQDLARPLLRALRGGRLRRLTLEVFPEEGARGFTLTPMDAWALWRVPRPLPHYAV